jgi:hypothetical protein
MPVLSYVHTSSTPHSVTPTSRRCGGKIGHSSVPGVRARTSIRGEVLRPPRMQTLLVQQLQAHLQ